MTDVDDGTKVAYDLPSPSKAGVVEFAKDERGKPIQEQGLTEEDIADKVGWNQRFGWPVESVLSDDSMLDHATWLEGKIPDTFFGGNLAPFPYSLRLHIATYSYLFDRLVPQCRCYHIRLSLLLAGRCPWWRLRMDHYYYGFLFDILSHLE